MRDASIRGAFVFMIAMACAAVAAGPLQDYDTSTHEAVLKQHKGQVVLINFWATWCAPCRKEMPLLVSMEKKLRSQGFRMITVSADEVEDKAQVMEFLDEQGVAAPVYLKNVDDDDAFIESISPEWSGALPALFLYGRDGKLSRSWVGETEISELEQVIRALL